MDIGAGAFAKVQKEVSVFGYMEDREYNGLEYCQMANVRLQTHGKRMVVVACPSDLKVIAPSSETFTVWSGMRALGSLTSDGVKQLVGAKARVFVGVVETGDLMFTPPGALVCQK
eukprot:10185683-Lingulodinium_polyedra.AAC.1